MEKHLRDIAQELRLIRIELQKRNNVVPSAVAEVPKEITYDEMKERAGDRVTIK